MRPTEIVNVGPEGPSPKLLREWRSLLASSETGTYFQTPEWIFSWQKHLAGQPAISLALWRDSNRRLTALLALAHSPQKLARSIPIRVADTILAGSAIGAADHTGWIAGSPDMHSTVAAWLAASARSIPTLLMNVHWKLGQFLRQEGAAPISSTTTPELPLSKLDEVQASSRYRRLRKYKRRLLRQDVQFRFLRPGEITEELLTEFIKLHGARARMTEMSTTFTTARLPFHKSLVESSTGQTGPSGLVCRLDGRVIAFSYGFLFGKAWSGYQLGWDPSFAKYSLGTVCVASTIEAAAELGLETFDFLRGSEDWKYQFQAVDRTETTWLLGSRPRALLLRAKERSKEWRR